ncbi:MAG: AMP nucleosidase [Alphaproteobacteria bacterium]|nr:AMP nucleosidase [Alphaproteobacteria bacterium]OJV46347.1 MAG: AMP nucleosidase [Alphaproteobacteria bacterium 43-37]
MTEHPEVLTQGGIRNVTVCRTADHAVQTIHSIYDDNVLRIKNKLASLISSSQDSEPLEENLEGEGYYPFVGINVEELNKNLDTKLSFGAIQETGFYGTTITRPQLFDSYLKGQLSLLIKYHKAPLYVGESNTPIPLPFAIDHEPGIAKKGPLWFVSQNFVLPDLSTIDDNIANATPISTTGINPLSLFTAPRVDISLHRLEHYTGTSAEHFQQFILLTNYQRYVDAFVTYSQEMLLTNPEYTSLIEPGNRTTFHADGKLICEGELNSHTQMPAYHLKCADGNGVTFINIGVGPSNAKTITDHLAVLRPHCWLMLGHCAGLRRSQLLGDYVLAHAYVREDHVLDSDLPGWIPIPPIAEVQVALQQAVAKVTGISGPELKSRMRTGTVFTTDNRNWEFRSNELFQQFQQSRAMALDMESATVAANGFRFRVPYGTLLCVSDKPVHGEIKLKGMANEFYRKRVVQHLEIGLETMRILRESDPDSLHSRKLRGFDDPPFR